jgi:hypothetical protein
MNKRKIDINELKKNSMKGSKYRTISVKYENVLAYFKQKEVKEKDIFRVDFSELIEDLVNQMSALELTFKIEHNLEEAIRFLVIQDKQFKLEAFNLKKIPTEYPIGEIAECLFIQVDEAKNQKTININKSKLMPFFKSLRVIYSEFCYCVGEKYIMEPYEYKKLYENCQVAWTKNEEKGKMSPL